MILIQDAAKAPAPANLLLQREFPALKVPTYPYRECSAAFVRMLYSGKHQSKRKCVLLSVVQVQQYRIAMTAKDCSIMIALSPCLQDEW